MEDKDIIALFFERSERAIEETSKKYGALCQKIASNVLGNFHDAQECVNDTYLKVWNNIPPTIPQILSAYVAKIARNLSINRFIKNNASKRGSGEIELVIDELGECLSDNNTVEKEIDKISVLESLTIFLKGEDVNNRSMFIQRYWYNFSVSEIAKAFEISESNVTTILYRMRNRLKIYLEKEEIYL